MTGARLYEDAPLRAGDARIRLLMLLPGRCDEQVRCRLFAASIGKRPYSTLSYVWGDITITKSIVVNGRTIQVTTNLEAALRYIRKPDKAVDIWVDAVCINQGDFQERGKQVEMMGQIYEQCSTCYIWLGCPELDYADEDTLITEDPFKFFQHFANNRHFSELPDMRGDSKTTHARVPHAKLSPLWRGFFTIASSAWWTRMWTVQEAILPPHCVIMYASWQVDWALLDTAYDNWLEHTLSCCYEPYKEFFPAEWDVIRRSFWDTASEIVAYRETFTDPKWRDWLNLTRDFDSRKATNPRDHVYGLLGLANKEYAAKIVPDYEADVVEVYAQSMRAMLDEHKGDLRPLTRHVFNIGIPGLPSWVPDFSRHNSALAKRENVRQAWHDHYDASLDHKADVKYLNGNVMQLSGVFVDEISHISEDFNSLLVLRLQRWWKLVKDKVSPFGLTESRSEKLHRTVRGDVKQLSKLDTGEQYTRWERLGSTRDQFAEDWPDILEGKIELSTTDSGTKIAVDSQTNQRTFFITSKGYMGFADPGVRPGDEVWLLYGGNVLFCLRPTESFRTEKPGQGFCFLGTCYLDGFMDGEVLDGPNRTRELLLH